MWTAPHARKAGGSLAETQVCGNRTLWMHVFAGGPPLWRMGGMELANPSVQASDGFDCATYLERGCEA